MKLGIISDTHDNVPMIQRAVEYFNDAHVDAVLHAGDYVSPFALKPFLSLKCDFLGVWGNNDGDKIAVQNVAQGKIENSPHIRNYGQKKVLLGHDLGALEPLVLSQEFHLIIYGHTHRPEIRTQGKTLVVNPGECGGWVEGKSTIALVDLETQKAKIVQLD